MATDPQGKSLFFGRFALYCARSIKNIAAPVKNVTGIRHPHAQYLTSPTPI
jgi:hypothetical protein